MAGEEERLTSFISTRKCAYRTPRSCVSVLSFPRITGFGMCVGRRPHGGSFVFPGTAKRPASLLDEDISTVLAEEEKQEGHVLMVGNNGLEPLTLCL